MSKTETGYKETEIGIIPKEWKVLTIPDLLVDEKGGIKMGPFGSQIKKEDLTTEGVHLIGIENVLQKDFIKTGDRYISIGKFESLKTNQVVPGDIVITTMGTVGYTGIIPNDIPPTIIDSHLIRLRANNKVLNYFLARIIQDYELVQKQIKRMSQGGIMAGLNTGIIKQLKIPVPSKKEQMKISRILESLDSVIEKTEAIIKQTEEVKKGLMQQLLTKGIEHTKFKETEIGTIPEEWEIKALGEIATRVSVGYVGSINDFYSDSSGVILLRTGNITPEGLDLGEVKYVTREFHEKNKKSQLEPGDIIVSRHGDSGTATVIPDCLIESNCLNVVVVKKSVKMNSMFIFYLFNSGIIKSILNKTKAGSVQGVINTKEISTVLVPYPSLQEQQKIVEILLSVDSKISSEQKKYKKLQLIKKGLMQSLLTGKVRVKVDEVEVTQV